MTTRLWTKSVLIAVGAMAFLLVCSASPSPTSGSAKIALSVQSGTAGTPVTVTGSGFPPQAIVALYVDLPGVYLGAPGPAADAQGAFKVDISWPGKNFDPAGRVKPATAGAHSICGDSGYPNSPPQVAAKACAQFTVKALSSPPAQASTASSGYPLPVVLAGFAILAVIGLGVVLWMRRTG